MFKAIPRKKSRETSLSFVGLCAWTTRHLFCTVHTYYVSVLVKFGRSCNALHKELYGEIRQVNSLLVGTNDTTWLLCSLEPHDGFRRKFTTWAVRSTTYVVFIRLELSRQLTSFTHRRHLVRIASLGVASCRFVSCRVLCEVRVKYLYVVSCRDFPDALVIRL